MKYLTVLLTFFATSALAYDFGVYDQTQGIYTPRQGVQQYPSQHQFPVISVPNAQGGERYFQGSQYLGESHRHPSGGRIWYPNPAVR